MDDEYINENSDGEHVYSMYKIVPKNKELNYCYI
jgi:hypothetical protein